MLTQAPDLTIGHGAGPRVTLRFMGAFALGFMAFAAHADLSPFFQMDALPKAPTGAVGAIALSDARYLGASDRRTQVFPTFSYYHPSGFFADALSGLGWNFSRHSAYDAGLRATLDFGRDEPPALRGLGKISARLNPGAFLNVNLTEALQLQSSLRYGSGYDHDGAQLDLGATCMDVSASYANRAHMQSYYGVSAAQSAASGHALYQPTADWHLLRAGLSGQVTISPQWMLYGGVEATRLIGQAQGSPYAQRKSASTLYLGVNHAIN